MGNGLNLPRTTSNTPLKVFCDHNGRTVDHKGQLIGKGYTSVQAEIESIRRAMGELNKCSHVKHVIVNSDCEPAVESVNRGDPAFGDFESVTVEWIPREENQAADMVATNIRYIHSSHHSTEVTDRKT